MRHLLSCFVLSAVIAVGAKAWSGRMDDTDARLPTDLLPYHYNLEILPYIYFPEPPLPFNGKVEIFFECFTATNVITISNDGLTIEESSISLTVSADSPGNPPTPVVTSWEHIQDIHFLKFHLDDHLIVGGRYVLSLEFTGTMKPASQGEGLYWDSYEDETGTTVYVAATQGESIFSRMYFPCFDEPAMKATFNTTVVRRSSLVSLSNMPLIRSDNRPDDFVADVYSQSPLMSAYQVCIAVGDFVSRFSGNINGYEVRIWSRPQVIHLMDWVAEIAAVLQAWLENATNQPYPLPKMDHIMLPTKGGAMENWGLITYGEQNVVYDPATSPAYTKLQVVSITAHELAHQWYGNLVTCDWWTDIWLQEGFATHNNYIPMAALGWEASEIQQIEGSRGTMQFLNADGKNTSDPVRKNITTGLMADYSFSGSTYPKGGAMLRMLGGILTEPTLNRAIQTFLDTWKYKTAVTDDLWDALSTQADIDGVTNPDGSPLDIKARMDPWLNQMGYPLVTVTRSTDGTAVVSRSHFLSPAHQFVTTPSEWNYAWPVPLTFVTAEDNSQPWDFPPRAWIDLDQTEITLAGLPTNLNDWVIFNARGRMFYRVNYDAASRAAINDAFSTFPKFFDGQTKTAFLDDSFVLARTLYILEADAMNATGFLADEFTYNPWYPAVTYFSSAQRLIENEPWFASYRAYVLSLTVPVYSTLGWTFIDSETPLEQYLRRDMISVSCNNGWNDCVDLALQEYYVARLNPSVNTVDPNILPVALCTGMMTFTGDWGLWFAEYQRRASSQVREERYSYLYGLACTSFQSNLVSYLNELIGTGIASRDKNTAAGYLALNNYGAVLLWNYLDQNWTSAAFSGRFTTLTKIVDGFSNQAGLDQLLAFIERHPAMSQSEENSYTQMLLKVRQNITWLEINRDSLRDWLAARTGGTDLDTLSRRMRTPLPVSPVYHWVNVMEERDNLKRY